MSLLDSVRGSVAATGPDRSADDLLTDRWLPAVQRTAGLPFVARAPHTAAQDLVAAAVLSGRTLGEHVHLANAYSVALADTRGAVGDVFAGARAWLLPDGRPLTWVSTARRDAPRLQQVRGPQFMLDVVEAGLDVGLRHYLLGGSPEVLRDLRAALEQRFPGASIVGQDSPPFRTPTEQEVVERDAAIHASGAQVVWIGLGTPKQDFEAARLARSLPVVAVAVGAAFDYAAGALTPAPHWVSVAGLEWLWRFAAEPRRLWKRYTIGNAQFLRAVVRSEHDERRADRSMRHETLSRGVTVVGQLPPPLHGSAVMTERLIQALQRTGRRVRVVDRRFSRTVDEVGSPSLRKALAVPSLMLRFVLATRQEGEVVLLLTTSPFSFLVDCALLALSRRRVTHYVHTVGFASLAARGAGWRGLVRWALTRGERVVVLGPSLVDDVAAFVPRERIDVVPNSTPAVAPQPHEPGARLLFLSNLLPGKGADVFVRVAHRLVIERPDAQWRFDLAGAGDADALGALPVALTVHGRVVGEAKSALLHAADVLVVPSTYAMEAQPLVIVEALAHGVAVVAYDNGGIRDLVDDRVGALVPAGDEAALTRAIVELIDAPQVLARARSSALARFEQVHSPRAYASAWERQLTVGTAPVHAPAMLQPVVVR